MAEKKDFMVFTGDVKMGDIVDANPSLLRIFHRMGMRMGFGESTVDQACAQAGVDPVTFLLIIKIYTVSDYVPSKEELDSVRVEDIMTYLYNSHKYYLEESLPAIEEAIDHLLLPATSPQKAVVTSFFNEYKRELREHFAYEEEKVFPYLEAISSGSAANRYEGRFEEDHTNIEEKIGDLKNIVLKYIPPSCDSLEASRLLVNIYALEEDLERHSDVEDKVLIPLIRKDELSAREKEILVSVAMGKLNKEIADEYDISIHTVITHRKNITRKTGIKTVAGLTVYAILNGLIDPSTI